MPDLSQIIATRPPLPLQSEPLRAALAWAAILDKPTAADFIRDNGDILEAQTVRLESENMAGDMQSAAGVAPLRRLIIFGVRNHAEVDDTDMEEGYKFMIDGDEYRCVDVIVTLGEIQGVFEATT